MDVGPGEGIERIGGQCRGDTGVQRSQISLSRAKQVLAESVWGGLPPVPDNPFLEIPEGLARGSGGHPLAEGHAWFAASLATWLSL
jgi:hypothetical protein